MQGLIDRALEVGEPSWANGGVSQCAENGRAHFGVNMEASQSESRASMRCGAPIGNQLTAHSRRSRSQLPTIWRAMADEPPRTWLKQSSCAKRRSLWGLPEACSASPTSPGSLLGRSFGTLGRWDEVARQAQYLIETYGDSHIAGMGGLAWLSEHAVYTKRSGAEASSVERLENS